MAKKEVQSAEVLPLKSGKTIKFQVTMKSSPCNTNVQFSASDIQIEGEPMTGTYDFPGRESREAFIKVYNSIITRGD